MKRLVLAVGVGLVAVAAGVLPAVAQYEDIIPDAEVLGLAWDKQTDRVWLAEGTSGRLTGYDAEGEQSFIEWEPAGTVQALASHENKLYALEVSDDGKARVLQFNNLKPGNKEPRSFPVAFPDDGEHQPTALMLSKKGNIYLVTSGEQPGVYRMAKEPSAGKKNELKRVSDAPAGVRDGVFLPDGETVALRTADELRIVDAFEWTTSVAETYVGRARDESVTLRGGRLLFAARAGLREAEIPAADAEKELPRLPGEPEAEPAPEPTTEPPAGETMEPAVDDMPREAESSWSTNSGTLVALGIASVIALLAGAITFFVKS